MKQCKPQKALKISTLVFDLIEQETSKWNLTSSTLCLTVTAFTRVLDHAFKVNQYSKPDIMKDFLVASMLMQSKMNVIVLLAGTSGTGKSTLASLVGARFGI